MALEGGEEEDMGFDFDEVRAYACMSNAWQCQCVVHCYSPQIVQIGSLTRILT
jgi:hypothetical protein